MTRQVHNNVEGLYPALDRKKLAQPYVVDGKNFIVDLDGPKSAFGYKQPWHEFDESGFMQSFPVGAEIFYFSRDVEETFVQVGKMDWLLQQIVPVARFAANTGRPKLKLPWTHALVGTYHYFANRTWGILQYDAITQNWSDVTATIGVSDIFFIIESDGRLVTLAEGLTSWSAIEDGMDNTTSLATGAGFQALSKIGSLESDADYLGLQKIANGYLSFTSKGVMRSQIIDSISPFRHITGESDEVPLTPWCITKINTTEVIILTRHGLASSKDGIFQPWQPLMSEYLKQVVIPPLQHLTSGYISIYYSQARDEFYVSAAASQVINHFTITYALYLVRDQWGIFNRTHQGFVFIDPESRGIEFQQAYISLAGQLNWLNDSSIPLVIEPQNANAIYIPVKTEYPVFSVEGVYVMPTVVFASSFSTVGYPEIAGFYEEEGVLSCYKTTETGEQKEVILSDEDIWGSWKVTDASITTIGELDAVMSTIALTIGNTYRLDWHFIKGSSDHPRMVLDTGHADVSLIGIDFTTCVCAVIDGVDGLTADVIVLGDDEYLLRAEWTTEAGAAELASLTLHPAYGFLVSLQTGSQYFKSVSLYDVADSSTELLTSVDDFANSIVWTPTDVTVEQQWNVFSTVVVTNSEMCLLGPVAQAVSQLPMDSYIEVGLFRFTQEEANDELSLITNLAISCLDVAEDSSAVIDDWMTGYADDIIEDWLLGSPDVVEDWGLELASGSAYAETIKGSLDGYVAFEDQEIAPDLVLLQGKTKFLTCQNQGVFQSVRLEASEVGESFHLKTLELNGTVAGRL